MLLKNTFKSHRLSIHLAIYLAVFISSSVSLAVSVDEKTTEIKEAVVPMRVMALPTDEIHIQGYRGSIEYITDDTAKDVTVNVEQGPSTKKNANENWDFHFRKDGQKVIVQVDNSAMSKMDWALTLQAGTWPEYKIKMRGPNLPLNIHWYEGAVSIKNLSAPIHITHMNSQIVIDGGNGPTSLNTHSGEIKISARKGNVLLDTYQAKVDLKNLEGDLLLKNFSGESKVKAVIGNITLNGYSGVSHISDIKGNVAFKNGNSTLNLDNIEGELRGESEQGPVTAEVQGTADVHLISNEGNVNLRLPASGAWVNLGTSGGNMAVPGFLKTTRIATQQIRTGKLKGANRGSVFVRTQSGNIQIR
jgi:hypothetical protein